MNRSTPDIKFPSEYRKAMGVGIVEQICLMVFSCLTGDFPLSALSCLYAILAYWAGAAVIIFRKRSVPSYTDVLFLKWGTLLLFVISMALSPPIWRMRGFFHGKG